MQTVEVENVTKTYGSRTVVDRVSFSTASREIFGLIGPNGAGKTTCIRMIMDIIKPDAGEVRLFGQKFTGELKRQIGYLPEERGLYRKRPIVESMVYLATLKGMTAAEARKKAESWLERVNLQAHRHKKIEELSHGMAQIIQFLVTILHEPRVIILDEPFNGLDPVNVRMVKDIILELKEEGRTIMLSTHRMNEVEELCDRIFMINRGQQVLYGDLDEIKSRFRKNSVLLECQGDPGEIVGVRIRRLNSTTLELSLDGDISPQQLLETLVARRIVINRFEVATPSLNDIFIQIAGGRK